MKILIDIGHPAHVHLFKNFAWKLLEEGHEIYFTVRDKENELFLLNSYGFKYISFGKHFKSRIGKVFGLLKFNFLMLSVSLKHKPELFISHGSIYAAQISWLLKKPHIALEDTGNMEQVKLYRQFTTLILTPVYLNKRISKKQVTYKGFHELAYLHPSIFKKNVEDLPMLNSLSDKPKVLIRFVSWNATHDRNQFGLMANEKEKLINSLSRVSQVFISSESELPNSMKRYKLEIPPDRIHDFLACISLYIGEGGTMATECACLGIPNILINSALNRNNMPGIHLELEQHGLQVLYEKFNEGIIDQAINTITDKRTRTELEHKLNMYLKDKINLTEFLIWIVKEYPNCIKSLATDKDLANNFINSEDVYT